MTVFISDLESAMLHWIIPIGGVFFILLGILAGVAAVLFMSSIQVDVKIKAMDAPAPGILEAVLLQVRAGQSEAFESAFREAQAIISSMSGYRSHELQRCLEREGQYLLLVRWDSVAAHEEGFRKSPQY